MASGYSFGNVFLMFLLIAYPTSAEISRDRIGPGLLSNNRHQPTAPSLLTHLSLQGYTCPRGFFDSRIQL